MNESPSPASVEVIARRALAASADVAPERVPAALPRAVATGRGDREAIAGMVRALGAEVGLDLVRFDTDRIAGYVFESSRPPVLAGASKILRDLNAGIARDYADWALLSAGGEGLLLVPRGHGGQLCREIEERYRRDSNAALGVTTASISVRPEDFVEVSGAEREALHGARLVTGTQALLSRLHDAIRKKKDETLPVRAAVAGNRPRCPSCRDRSEGTTRLREDLGRDEDGSLCDPCARRWRSGKLLIAGESFDDLIRRWSGVTPSGTRKESYLGFLYADGNGMGALFGRLGSLAELQVLSFEVTACFEALRERVRGEVNRILRPTVEEKAETLFLDLLAGGDEVIWILPAGLAVHVSERLPAWLDAEVAGRPALVALLGSLDRSGLSLGIGLALCSLGYPVRYQYQLAKALQKEAKHRLYSTGREESTIDFELLTDSSPLSQDWKSLRRLVAKTEEAGFYRTCRPLGREEMTRLRERIELALDSELALSQLYTLAAGSLEGRRPFLNLARYQIAREPAAKRYQKWLAACGVDASRPAEIESFFVQPTDWGSALWIADALELLPFLAGLRGRLEEGRA